MLCADSECYGCFSCRNSCPKHAISFIESKMGGMVPDIDSAKCIDCHICQKSCPVLNPQRGNRVRRTYAAFSKEQSILSSSASGGIASTLYMYAISKDGAFVGTEYVDGTLQFGIGVSAEDIKRFSGSKYIHAYVNDTYSKIKSLLKSEKFVVFIGTPCQVAGLKSYLGIEYPNLLLVDLLCHGVSPQSYLKEYIFHKKGSSYEKAYFRGYWGNRLAVINNDEIIYLKDKFLDEYSMAYAKSVIIRENCYSCPFTSLERQGDITIGDFWGLDKKALSIDAEKVPFISLLMVNSQKGVEVFEEIQDKIAFEQREVEEALSGNRQLSSPPNTTQDRKIFEKYYSKGKFMFALRKTEIYKITKKKAVLFKVKTPLRNFKRLLRGK